LCFKSFPVDTDRLKPADLPRNPVPLIVHATNHRRVKGTDVLIEATKRLNALGIECELKIVENVDRHTAFEIYRRADIISDQFVIGAYGVFALEALALSKPTLTYLDHDHATRDLAAGAHRNFAGSPGPDHSATPAPAAAHLAGRSDECRPDEWALAVCTLGRHTPSAGSGFRRLFQ